MTSSFCTLLCPQRIDDHVVKTLTGKTMTPRMKGSRANPRTTSPGYTRSWLRTRRNASTATARCPTWITCADITPVCTRTSPFRKSGSQSPTDERRRPLLRTPRILQCRSALLPPRQWSLWRQDHCARTASPPKPSGTSTLARRTLASNPAETDPTRPSCTWLSRAHTRESPPFATYTSWDPMSSQTDASPHSWPSAMA